MPSSPTHAQAAAASAAASRLATHSVAQAKTALELAAALSLERLRLLCPESDAYDIRRLGAHMAELRGKLRDPLEALKLAASKGRLESTFCAGEGLAKSTLRRACASVAMEIDAANAGLPEKISSSIEALERIWEDGAALGELGGAGSPAPAASPGAPKP